MADLRCLRLSATNHMLDLVDGHLWEAKANVESREGSAWWRIDDSEGLLFTDELARQPAIFSVGKVPVFPVRAYGS